jgi:tRNA (cmo5U34)-methyltransferase
MISDLVTQDNSTLTKYSWECYEEYLNKIGGNEYSKKVLDYVEKEDSPRSINYQLELMRRVGFRSVEILHKNICFAAFGGIK